MVTSRCWFHKTANVLAALPKSAHPAAKKALAEIWGAENKRHALDAVIAFKAMEMLHIYAELAAAGAPAEQQYPGIAAHLRACGPCGDDWFGFDPAQEAEWRDLLAATRRAVDTEFTDRQRAVFVAIVLNDVPLDALVLELRSNQPSTAGAP